MPGRTVVIVGGGLAGLAAATALASRGFAITILEARNRLGGRAGSFQDAATGQLVDACQHVTMGCCTNFTHFCQTVGIAHLLQPQPAIYFMTSDRRLSRFRANPWPAPLHLAGSFARAHFLSFAEKVRIGYGLYHLERWPDDDDPPFGAWLNQHRQTPRTIDRFWGLVLTSALNETPERVGLRYARKVFVDGFLRHRRGFEISLPTVPLGRLYGQELQDWLARRGVVARFGVGVRRLLVTDGRVHGVQLRSDEWLKADVVIAAVPHERLLDLLPWEAIAHEPYFANLRRLDVSPITSAHLWFDRPIMNLPHVVLVDGVGQWVFNRSQMDLFGRKASRSRGPDAARLNSEQRAEYYIQVVVSAARQFRGLGHREVERRIIEELRHLFPAACEARLLRARVVTEHAATFSAVPGVDQWRPPQKSPLENLYVAGDWTQTGWPATMEGAVRSGYLAAEALLAKHEIDASLLQLDLR